MGGEGRAGSGRRRRLVAGVAAPAAVAARAARGRERRGRGVVGAWVAACTLATLAGVAGVGGVGGMKVRLNLSPSLPRGVYGVAPVRRPLRPGDLVLACAPAAFGALARARGYLPGGRCPGGVAPLGKVVLAVPGDEVDVNPAGLVLNGQPLPGTSSQAADSRGRPLPHYPAGRYAVPCGQVWLVSPHPRSLDSRYFGPIQAGGVLGSLTPLATATGAAIGPLAKALRRAGSSQSHGTVQVSPPAFCTRAPSSLAMRRDRCTFYPRQLQPPERKIGEEDLKAKRAGVGASRAGEPQRCTGLHRSQRKVGS
jgi:conjugative transfer signal peptidase TraF